jgi:CheY-like chemotaxis protein
VSHREPEAGGIPPALAATIHDTTNALTVVLGWLERAGQADANRDEALERAATHARWARDQLRRAIVPKDPNQPAALSPSPEESEVDDAATVARLTIDDLVVEAQRAGVVLESTISEAAMGQSLPAADAAWQVLTNLLLNAIAMTPRGGRVSLELDAAAQGIAGPPPTPGSRFVRFLVRDDGPGIPADRRATLFEGGVSTRPGGAGLGLKNAHALARDHGGRLSLIDEPSTGASFELIWPTLAKRRGLDGMRVLLLEDDAAVIELLELGLTARGAALTVVRTAEHLDRALDEQPYDVVLVDLSPLAPAAAGAEAGKQLGRIVELGRARCPDVTVVAISGSVANSPAPDLLWVRKPFAPGELADAIVRARAAR